MITLTCSSPAKPDGIGAQLQRKAAVYEIAKALNFGYADGPIRDFGFNPGDGVGTDTALKEIVLSNINARYSLPNLSANNTDSSLTISKLTGLSVLNLLALNARKGHHLVNIPNPFPFFDRTLFSYKNVMESWSRSAPSSSKGNKLTFKVDLHIRRAVTPKKTTKTSSYIRHMPTSWYVRVCEIAVNTIAQDSKVHFRIHTDGTKAGGSLDIREMPLDEGTRKLWSEQGFLDSSGYLEQHSEELGRQFQHLGSVEVLQELRPDVALNSMIESDLLIGAKSSFSFIAGLARKNKPVVFSKFWHRNPSDWVTLTEDFRGPELSELLLGYRLNAG